MGDDLDQTACSPRRHRTSLPTRSGTEFFRAETDRKFRYLSSIEGAETALNKKFGRHVFDIAEVVRASLALHNLRVWMVGTI